MGLCSHGVCDNIMLTALPEVDIVVAERLHASKAVTTKSIRLIVVKLSGQSVIKKKGNVVSLEQRHPEDRNMRTLTLVKSVQDRDDQRGFKEQMP